MFIEPNLHGDRRGWIEVICGSMFSGKTEELIRRLKRVTIANQKLLIFKPAIDLRFDEEKLVSHDTNVFPSTPIYHSREIIPLAQDVDVIGIDEAQFFDEDLPAVCDELAYKGIRVIVAGLDMDYRAMPFGQMPFMLAKADYVTKLHAICMKCGNIANYSYRKAPEKDQLLLGAKDMYEPRCRICYNEG